jgi:hypothetical protein
MSFVMRAKKAKRELHTISVRQIANLLTFEINNTTDNESNRLNAPDKKMMRALW